jgi:N-acetyl-anhydromuramyl-L-alanine amidase AmpD
MTFVDSIIQHEFPVNQYINQVFDKDQIVIHHTASSADPFGVMEYWISNTERVGTAFLIAGNPRTSTRWKDGDIFQLFNSSKGAWHLGLKAKDLVRGGRASTNMNMMSIGVETCNWGQLVLKNGKFITYEGNAIPEANVHEYATPYRGYKYYEKYTDPQIEALRNLLVFLCDKYEIDKTYKGDEIFEIDKRPLRGENGIWTHTTVRTDKEDMHPYPPLIAMLKSL